MFGGAWGCGLIDHARPGGWLFETYASKDKAWTVVKGWRPQSHHFVTEHPLYAEMAEWYLKYLRAGEK